MSFPEEHFTERELLAYDYISNNPNCIKEDVVKYMNLDKHPLSARASRVPAFRAIKELTDPEHEVVREYPDEKNRHTLRLVVNQNSKIGEILQKIRIFNTAFFGLFTKVTKEITSEKRMRRAGKSSMHTDNNELVMVRDLVHIFYTMIETIQYLSLNVWPRQITDAQTLKTIYSFVFKQIADMQLRLVRERQKIDPTGNLTLSQAESRWGRLLTQGLYLFQGDPSAALTGGHPSITVSEWARYGLQKDVATLCGFVSSIYAVPHTSEKIMKNLKSNHDP